MIYGNRGVALLLVLVTLAIVSVVSVEIIFSSRVDFRIGRNARDRLQAEYLAQSAANLALLRLNIYGELKNLMERKDIPIQIPDTVQEQIWSLNFPPFPLPDDISKAVQHFPGYFFGEIKTEGSKIPINLLDGNVHRKSDSKLQTQIQDELKTLINGSLEDEEFSDLYPDLKPEDLINPLIDWIDADSNKIDGGDESGDYDSGEDIYSPRNDRIPTLSEIVMVRNWNDDLLNRFSSSLSVLNNSTEVNPNFLPLTRIKAYGPKLTEAELKVIDLRRRETPFSSLKDLENFIKTSPDIKNGQDFEFPAGLKEQKAETIFWVLASGVVGEARKTLRLGIKIPREMTIDKETREKKPGKLIAPEVVLVEEKL